MFGPVEAVPLGKTWTDESELERSPVVTSLVQGSQNVALPSVLAARHVAPWPR